VLGVNHVELSPQQVKLNAEQERVVLLVEDDPSVLRALRRLVMGAGFKVLTFDRPSAILAANIPKTDACLVVDFHLPEMNGVELRNALAGSGCRLPLVIITGHVDEQTLALIACAPRSMALFKPFRRKDLLVALALSFAAGQTG
jgi:FixJ family two-component response regulator